MVGTGHGGLVEGHSQGPFPLSSSGTVSTLWLHMPETLASSLWCQWGQELGASGRGPTPAPSESPEPRGAFPL